MGDDPGLCARGSEGRDLRSLAIGCGRSRRETGIAAGESFGRQSGCDSEREVNNLFGRVLEKFKRLHILVNNAGFAWPRGGPVNLELAETPLDVWTKVLYIAT